MKNKKAEISTMLIILLLVGAGYYLLIYLPRINNEIPCPALAMLCPDKIHTVGYIVINGTCVMDTCPVDEQACINSGGRWNECGSRCQIDNQGKSGVACTTVCEELCECGTIVGLKCPSGYYCKMPSGIADAMGYCIK